MINPRFEVSKDRKGEYRFRLKARNGKIIAVSEGYKTKAGCLKGIRSVKENVLKARIELVFGKVKRSRKLAGG